MERTDLSITLEIAGDIKSIGYQEYLFLLGQALMQLSESASDMNKREESERWESRSAEVDELVANDVIKHY